MMKRISVLFFKVVLMLVHADVYSSECQTISHEALKYNLVSGLPDVYISKKTEQIGATWKKGCVWDKPLIEKFYAMLKKRDDFFVVLDVGAQTGSFTLLAKYFPNSQWHAFEPIPEAVNELKENLALNGIRNVTVHSVCVSDQNEERYLKLPKDHHWGLATLADKILRFKDYDKLKVNCLTLDYFVYTQNIKKIDFIKLDTEGWELFVLKGGKKMISQDKPIILMELNKDNLRQSSVAEKDIYRFLKEMGYEWEFVSHEDILCTPRPSGKV